MNFITMLSRQLLWNQLHKIAERNRQKFFSDEWQASIVQEYADNMNQALITMNQNFTGKHWKQLRELERTIGIASIHSQEEIDQVLGYLNSK